MSNVSVESLGSIADSGMFRYGAIMPIDDFLAIFEYQRLTDDDLDGLAISDIRSRISSEALDILGIFTRFREIMLKRGKWLVRDGEVIRVPLASENAAFATKYFHAAAKKVAKAEKLQKASPIMFNGNSVDNLSSRISIMQSRISKGLG